MSDRARPPESMPREPMPGPAPGTSAADGRLGGHSARLLAGLGLAAVGSVVLSLGAAVEVVTGARPGYLSWPVLAVLAALPAALAIGLAWRGRPNVAVGVLAAGAVLAPGRMLLDSQFVVDASRASRPELYVAVSLQSPAPQLGLWLLFAGHLAALLAGVLALGSLRSEAEPEGPSRRVRQQALTASTLIGMAAAASLALPPFRSDNVYLLSGSALDGPELVTGGTLVLAVAIPLSAALSVTARSWHVTRGTLLGLAVGVSMLQLPNLVSVWSLPWLHIASGPVVGLIAVVGLVAFAVWPIAGTAPSVPAAELTLPGRSRLHAATGVLALLTAGFAVAGGVTPQLVSLVDGSVIEAPSSGLLLLAAVLVALPGAAMLFPGVAAAVRPALSVLWVSVLFAGTTLLATSVVAAKLPGATQPGPGVWWTVLAMVVAVLLAVCSVVAGMVDREYEGEGPEEGPTDQNPDVRVWWAAAGSGVLAVGSFGTSTIVAPDYPGSGLWQDFGVPFFGLLCALLAVLGALALAPRCRPARAAALLIGATGVVGLRALEMPVVGPGVPGAAPGLGMWLALASVVMIAATAALSVVSHRISSAR